MSKMWVKEVCRDNIHVKIYDICKKKTGKTVQGGVLMLRTLPCILYSAVRDYPVVLNIDRACAPAPR